MKIHRWPPQLPGPVSLAIGNFDGVHRGHQQLLARLQADRAAGYTPLLLSFYPHPKTLTQNLNPPLISNLRDRARWLAHFGLDHWLLLAFNRALMQLRPSQFIAQYLQPLGVERLHVGEDFRFGYRGAGSVETLRRQKFLRVEALPPVCADDGTRISSSDIRAALAAHDFPRVEALLGHEFTLSGHVRHGFQRGRQLNAPTANLAVPDNWALANGVYIVRMGEVWGVANVGTAPTFGGGRRLLEAHFLRPVGNLYGQVISLSLKHFLRPEKRFTSSDALRLQIQTDIEITQNYLKEQAHERL